jgi:tetrahydromethanopterin S-methyltransferase subunit B
MRKAQKDYFMTRQVLHLEKAKKLEREVDKFIKSFDPRQNNIFDI